MDPIRKELLPGVYLNYVHAVKFKTGTLGAQFITPMDEALASPGALLPEVLYRGTARCPDMRALGRAFDLLYGASGTYTVRKKGENQCLGFVSSFIDDAYAPGGERLLEPMAALLGELLLDPVTENGRFWDAYVESEKINLIDTIHSLIDDKRTYADMRLLQEMCRGERYGVARLGTEERVEKLDSAALWAFYQNLLATARLELFYCGSAAQQRVEDALLDAFSALPRGERAAPVVAEHRDAPETPRYVSEKMDVTQGKLSMGFRASTEDAPAMLLANLVFGGYSNSKLFLNVREKLSLCYYASSGYHRSKGIVTVSSGVEYGNFRVAHDEILTQLKAVQDGAFEPWELEGARGVLVNSLRSREDSGGRMEENALGQAATGIFETTEELIGQLQTVTPERVAAAARSMALDTVYFLSGEEEEADD